VVLKLTGGNMEQTNSLSENLATSFIHLIKDMNTPALLTGPRSRVGKIVRPSISSELSDLTSSGMVEDTFDILDPLPKGSQDVEELVDSDDPSTNFPIHDPLASLETPLEINLGGFNPLAYLGGGDNLSDLPSNPHSGSAQGAPRIEKPIPVPGTVQYKDPRLVHDMLNELKLLD
jgi:hypothetical protein